MTYDGIQLGIQLAFTVFQEILRRLDWAHDGPFQIWIWKTRENLCAYPAQRRLTLEFNALIFLAAIVATFELALNSASINIFAIFSGLA